MSLRKGFIPVFAKIFLFYVPQVTEQANNDYYLRNFIAKSFFL
jgi:hypothetical protein